MVRTITAENRNIVFLPRSQSFVEGDTAIPKYQSFVVKGVEDVTYELGERPF